MTRTRPFKEFIEPDAYQVFLMICPASMPFSFATHPWFVVNRKGVLTRYGVSWRNARMDGTPVFGHHVCDGCVGHVHKDGRPPDEGIAVLLFSEHWLWKGKVLGTVSGGEDSLAKRMIDFIENSLAEYPYSDRYSLTGPNSNTYPQWVLNHFPQSGLRLPWNAVGKGCAK